MKKIFLYIKAGIGDLIKNKSRSVLTSLGIVIGVYSVVVLLALGQGIKIYIEQQFNSIGTNMIYVMPFKLTQATRRGVFNPRTFDESDYKTLRLRLKDSTVAPIVTTDIQAQNKSESITVSIYGSTRDIFFLMNTDLDAGRYFSNSEASSSRKVAVIASDVTKELFPKKYPIGQTITIQNIQFTVIGVLKSKGSGKLGGRSLDAIVYIPYKTAQQLTNTTGINAFYIKGGPNDNVERLAQKITRIFLKTYDKDKFSVSTQQELLSTISSIFSVINAVLIGIAAISLLVGGIGITNIMYVTVAERTKEIGIRRAVGAQKKHILAQFVTEAVLLTTFGGVLGLVLAYITTFFITFVFPAKITFFSVFAGFFVSVGIGILFGVLPARKAANRSPVEAIRSE